MDFKSGNKKESIVSKLLSKGYITQEEGRVLLDIDVPLYAEFPSTHEEFSKLCDNIWAMNPIQETFEPNKTNRERMEDAIKHQYTPKERKPEVIFMCSKADVAEILNYHQEKGKFKENTFKLFKEILDSQPDPFIYYLFVQECQQKSYTPKMIMTDKERFYNSFRLRMYKFKKGKDWRLI